MQFFLDSCNVKEIATLYELGIVDGVTTNPSIIAKSGLNFKKVLKEICEIVTTSVSAEVISEHYDGMMEEAQELLSIGKQITIKVPLTFDGLKACNSLSKGGVKVNVTLCFSTSQALLAAKAGATYISPFIGRVEDICYNGLNLIKDITCAFANYPDISTEVLVASIRSPYHVGEVAKMGADIATIPVSVMHQMLKHPLTDKGLEIFKQDWERANVEKV